MSVIMCETMGNGKMPEPSEEMNKQLHAEASRYAEYSSYRVEAA